MQTRTDLSSLFVLQIKAKIYSIELLENYQKINSSRIDKDIVLSADEQTLHIFGPDIGRDSGRTPKQVFTLNIFASPPKEGLVAFFDLSSEGLQGLMLFLAKQSCYLTIVVPTNCERARIDYTVNQEPVPSPKRVFPGDALIEKRVQKGEAFKLIFTPLSKKWEISSL